MPGPFSRLRDIWDKSVKPHYTKKEPPKNLFGHRYDAMLKLQATLTPFEKDQMNLFIALKEIDDVVKTYPDYLREASAFCDLRLATPDSPLSEKFDLDRLAHFQIAVDLLIASGATVGQEYMDLVRAKMPVPLTPEIRQRAINAERQALLAEIASLRGPKADN